MEQYENFGFYPIPSGNLCPNCDFKLSCEVQEEFKDNLDEIFKKIFFLSEKLEVYKKEAKKIVQAQGKKVIEELGIEFDLYPTFKKEINADFLIFLQEKNLNPSEFLKWDIEKIEKLAKKYPEVSNYITYEPSYYRFSFRKIKEQNGNE